MVVTRRTPAPHASASRTPSTQPIPRLAKKATHDALHAPDESSPLVNGSSYETTSKPNHDNVDQAAGQASAASKSTKTKGKQKPKKGGMKRSERGTTSLAEVLVRMFLLWFTIYTLSVCPQDEHLKSPVCRGLAEYRRIVIEPYIIPPIQQALAHPSVAPYVEKAKPYANYAVRMARPIAIRAHKEFNARVVPQWNQRVVPLYYKYAVPQLLKLDAQTAPYRSRVEQEYERILAPYLRRTVATLHQWQRKARPYVALAAEKTYQGYQLARPYARPLWENVKVGLAQLAAILGEQRRQFVDPHVKKIWEHVKEMSNGKPQVPSTSQLRSSASSKLSEASSHISQASAKVSSTLSSVVSSVSSMSSAISSSVVSKDQTASSAIPEAVSSSEAPHVQTIENARSSGAVAADNASSAVSSASGAFKSTTSAVSSSVSSSLSPVLSAASDAVSSSASSLAFAASSVADASVASAVVETTPSVVSTLAESATTAMSDVLSEAGIASSSEDASVATEASSSASSANLIPSSAVNAASVTATEALASVSVVADSLPPIVSSPEEQTESDPDVLDLLSDPDLDIFKAELGLTEDFLEGKEVPQAPLVHEETEEEREERIRARKEQVAQERAALDRRHSEWERQVEELIEENKQVLRNLLIGSRKAAIADLKENVAVQKEIDGLVDDADKFLRGAEKYMANLQKEYRRLEEKKAVWHRVVAKLEEKFSDRLRQTETVVNGWYNGILEKEIEEVKKLTAAVKDLAERGQADIGLDYAYLDDVSYIDWQRYHDLVRRAENFTVYAQGMQDGSDQSAPINPVIPAIQELQEEVEDVIKGFNARLRMVKRSGARVFGSPEEAAEDEDGSASILPIQEPEQTESPTDDAAANIPPVMIGRGKAEVEAALNRVADLEGRKTSSPDEPEKVKDADAVAQSLEDAVANEATSASSPAHEEL